MGEEEKSHTDVFIRQTTFPVFLTQALGAECTRKEMELTSSKRAQGSGSMPSRQEDKLRLPLSRAQRLLSTLVWSIPQAAWSTQTASQAPTQK